MKVGSSRQYGYDRLIVHEERKVRYIPGGEQKGPHWASVSTPPDAIRTLRSSIEDTLYYHNFSKNARNPSPKKPSFF